MVSDTTIMMNKILKNQKCINLYNENGQGIGTPVWFARENNNIYIMVDKKSWKAKRIANNTEVDFVSCSYSGKVRKRFKDLRIRGRVEFLEIKERDEAEKRVAKKYWFLYRFYKNEKYDFLKLSTTGILKTPDEEACDD
jgi:PPOX class probable F420-dependent enzyme